MLLAEAERALTELQYSDNKSFASGMLLYALNTLFQSVQRHRQYFSPAEWRAVRADIMTLSDNDVPIESKSRVVSDCHGGVSSASVSGRPSQLGDIEGLMGVGLAGDGLYADWMRAR